MVAFNKFETFVGDLGNKVHDLDADTLKCYLSNATPSASADSVLLDLADISAGNGYTAGGEDATGVWSETSGTGTLAGTDIVWTASGGTIGSFRYVVLYNDTPVSPADPLIGWWDYGSSITLNDGETFTTDFGASILTIA
jgi:hypothetical protein